MEGITLVESEQIEKKLQIILRQTEYSNEKALEKLKQFNFDEMSVIKDYFGITKKSAPGFTERFVLLIGVIRLLKSQINQALVADFDCFHGV